MKRSSRFALLSIFALGCTDAAVDSQGNLIGVESSAAAQVAEESAANSEAVNTLNIIKLKSKYSFAVDLVTKDQSKINQLTDLMTDDIVVNYGPSGTYTGKAAVANFFQNILPLAVAWGFHMPLNPVINLTSSRTATGEWYVHALGVYKSAYGAGPQPVYGRYQDTYVKTRNGWQFKTITLTIDTPPTGP